MSRALNWRHVLADWCDPRPAATQVRVPTSLAEFLRAGGAQALSLQNCFQEPVDQSGWSVFYVENQGCCAWAYRTADADPDPHVYVSELDQEAGSPSYVPVGCRVDAFLSAAALTEAVLGSATYRSGVCRPGDVDDLLGLSPLDLPELGWPKAVRTSYYSAPDVLAFAEHERGGMDVFVFVAARCAEALHALDERLRTSTAWDGLAWDPSFDGSH